MHLLNTLYICLVKENQFEVIIIGGSYAGLSAAMALGRSLRHVLVMDNNDPCNKQTPRSHNFITQDGEIPANIIAKAKTQLALYKTIQFHHGLAMGATKNKHGFTVTSQHGQHFHCKKILFATGVKDETPPVPGFAECWGISVLHCPYCHGYEVTNEPMAVLANGDIGYEFTKLISHWTAQLTLLTNGPAALTAEQQQRLHMHHISIIDKKIESIEHRNGYMTNLVFTDQTTIPLTAVFARVPFRQHSDLPQTLGCIFTEAGHIQVDEFQKTSIAGLFAAGDNTTMFRSVAAAVAAGNKAGAIINHELINEEF